MAASALQLTKPPKTKRAIREMAKRDPQTVEHNKKAMFIKIPQTNQFMTNVLTDLYMLKKPDAIWYRRKDDNKLSPFEDMTSLEFFSNKSDASLFALGSHSKKRPYNLILGRMFNYHLLDMIEFGVDGFKSLEEFKNDKNAVGSKPMFVLDGDLFNTDENFRVAGNLFVDFFRGEVVDRLNLAGLDHLIQLTAVDGKIFFRHYMVRLKKSGSQIPRVDLEEIGPSYDLTLRRTKLASEDLRQESLKQAKKAKKQKNVATTIMKDTVGTVHVPAQDLDKLNAKTTKVKALRSKRSHSDKSERDPDASEMDLEGSGVEESTPKRTKL